MHMVARASGNTMGVCSCHISPSWAWQCYGHSTCRVITGWFYWEETGAWGPATASSSGQDSVYKLEAAVHWAGLGWGGPR